MSGVAAVLAVARKDFRIAVSYRIAFAVSIFGGFWGLLGFRVVSTLVDGGQFHGSRTAYFDFTVLGLALALVAETAATAGARAVRGDQVQGTLEYLASQPVPRLVLGLSWSAYSAAQATVVSAAIVGMSGIIGFRFTHFAVGAVLATIVLTVAVFLALGNVAIAIVLVLQQGGGTMAMVVGLCALLGGVLYPVSALPGFAQPFVHVSPLTYSLAVLRTSLLSGQPATSTAEDLLVLLAFAAVLLPLSGLVLRGAFSLAQRRGTLSTY